MFDDWEGMDVREELSKRQKDVYHFIVVYLAMHGYPPTLREIASAIGLASTNGVADHLKALERKGYVERKPGISRAITLVA